ncbi:nucleotide-sugar transporter [Apiospora arundinis]
MTIANMAPIYAVDLPELGPHPPHALFADDAPERRPPILYFDGHLPDRGHQAGYLFDVCHIRGIKEPGALDPRHRHLRTDLQCRLLGRRMEAGHPGLPLHLTEHAAVRGCGKPGSGTLPDLVPAQDPHNRHIYRDNAREVTVAQALGRFGDPDHGRLDCVDSIVGLQGNLVHDPRHDRPLLPRSVHELGQVANGMGEVARELTKRTVDGLADVGGTLMKRSATYEGIEEDQNLAPVMNYSIGLSAVIVAALVSGLTGVYFEKVLKDPASAASVWTRNIQLSFYSLFPALFVGIFFKDGEEIAKHGFFDGYNWVVWALILLQAFGGVLASLCINYADNIAKNFATSISIVISFLFSVYFFNVGVSLTFLIGTILVLASTFLYSGPDRKRGRPPPINIVTYEKTTIDPMNTPRSDNNLAVPNPLENVKGMGLSTSRPSSPLRHHSRVPSSRGKHRDE